MPNFIATKEAPAYEKADDSSKKLGTLHEGQIINGDVEDGFVKTQIDSIAAVPVFFDTLEDVQEISLSPEPIAVEELGVFCAMVTKAARACGTDRDYLMAVAYSETKNLQDLGQEGAKRVGPFQFSEEEWKAAITTGPAKDRHFLPEERFQWSSQPEVAALLAAERTGQLKADTALGRDPTFAELYFAQLFGPDADQMLKRPRTDTCPAPAQGTYAADLALASGGMSIGAVLTDLQDRLTTGYTAALEIIEVQPPEIRIFRLEDQGDPPWLAIAQNEMARGVSETPGGRNSEEIKVYLATTGVEDLGDDTAWCGAFATFCMKKSGFEDVENSVKTPASATAAWWKNWGRTADDPSRTGTVVVLRPQSLKSSGHVGFLVGESGGRVELLAGNQGGHGGPDRVSVVPFATGEVVERRWLDVAPMPATIPGLDARTLLQKGINVGPGDNLFVRKAPGVMNDLMRDFPDLTVERAAAILGNIGQECGGFTQLEQPGGGGRGWCQWDGDRREAFFAFADAEGFPRESDDANYGYLRHELKDTSEGQVLQALKKDTTLEGAVKTFNDVFERSGKPMMDKRIRYAQLALEAFKSSSA
jgi:uncharacterized protein (TIGR02594 family)